MIRYPRIGQTARVHYRKALQSYMPHHGKIGVVLARAKGPGPRNHLLRLECGTVIACPAGNLQPVEEDDAWTSRYFENATSS